MKWSSWMGLTVSLKSVSCDWFVCTRHKIPRNTIVSSSSIHSTYQQTSYPLFSPSSNTLFCKSMGLVSYMILCYAASKLKFGATREIFSLFILDVIDLPTSSLANWQVIHHYSGSLISYKSITYENLISPCTQQQRLFWNSGQPEKCCAALVS